MEGRIGWEAAAALVDQITPGVGAPQVSGSKFVKQFTGSQSRKPAPRGSLCVTPAERDDAKQTSQAFAPGTDEQCSFMIKNFSSACLR